MPEPTGQPEPQLDVSRPWDEVAPHFLEAFPTLDPATVRQEYESARARAYHRRQLDEARQWAARSVQDQPGSIAQSFPVVSSLLNVGHNVIAHYERQRIEAGTPEPGDYRAVAFHERQQQLAGERGVGGQIASVVAGAPAMIGEAALAGSAVRGAGGVLQRVGEWIGPGRVGTVVGAAGRVFAPVAAEETVPWLSRAGIARLGTRAGLGAAAGELGAFAARQTAAAPLMPSLYAEHMVQNNEEAHRHPLDIRGAPPALAVAAINNIVLGSMSQSADFVTRRGLSGFLARTLIRAGVGVGEQQAADLLSYGLHLQNGYGTLEEALRGEQGRPMQHATVQAVTFALFGLLHEAQHAPGQPHPAFEDFAERLRQQQAQGVPPDTAARRVVDEAAEAVQRNAGPVQPQTGLPEGLRGPGRQPPVENAPGSPRTSDLPPERPTTLPAADVPAADATAQPITPAAPVEGFRTALGSTYEVHANGTTTRTKSVHDVPGHEGDFGRKTQSERTVYVPNAMASALSAAGVHGLGPQGSRLVIHDGRATLLTWNAREGRWGAAPSGRDIPIQEAPAVGLHPLELWGRTDDIPGAEAYRSQHAGNAIVEITQRQAPQSEAADEPQVSPPGSPGPTQLQTLAGQFAPAGSTGSPRVQTSPQPAMDRLGAATARLATLLRTAQELSARQGLNAEAVERGYESLRAAQGEDAAVAWLERRIRTLSAPAEPTEVSGPLAELFQRHESGERIGPAEFRAAVERAELKPLWKADLLAYMAGRTPTEIGVARGLPGKSAREAVRQIIKKAAKALGLEGQSMFDVLHKTARANLVVNMVEEGQTPPKAGAREGLAVDADVVHAAGNRLSEREVFDEQIHRVEDFFVERFRAGPTPEVRELFEAYERNVRDDELTPERLRFFDAEVARHRAQGPGGQSGQTAAAAKVPGEGGADAGPGPGESPPVRRGAGGDVPGPAAADPNAAPAAAPTGDAVRPAAAAGAAEATANVVGRPSPPEDVIVSSTHGGYFPSGSSAENFHEALRAFTDDPPRPDDRDVAVRFASTRGEVVRTLEEVRGITAALGENPGSFADWLATQGGQAVSPAARAVMERAREKLSGERVAPDIRRQVFGQFDRLLSLPGGDAGRAVGSETDIAIPGGRPVHGRYEVRELASLTASNQVLPGGAIRDRVAAGEYPQSLQPRDYMRNAAEQQKVLRHAAEMVPAYFISNHPDATSGPPTVSSDGTVLNGNGRTMTLERSVHAGTFDRYRAELARQAQSFGIDPLRVQAMERPVLVRVVNIDPGSPEAQRFARAGNISATQTQGVAEQAASLSHIIPGNIAEQIRLEPDSTFSRSVSGPAGKGFREQLLNAVRREVPSLEADLFERGGANLTDKGTEFVRQMLLTRVLPPDLIRDLGEQRRALMNGIENVVPQLLLLQRGNRGTNITPQLRDALEVFARHPEMRTQGDVERVMGQGDLFTGMNEHLDPGARMLLDFLVENRDASKRLRDGLVRVAEGLSLKAGGLFGDEVGTVASAAAEALGVAERPGAYFGHDREVEDARRAAIRSGASPETAEEIVQRGEASADAQAEATRNAASQAGGSESTPGVASRSATGPGPADIPGEPGGPTTGREGSGRIASMGTAGTPETAEPQTPGAPGARVAPLPETPSPTSAGWFQRLRDSLRSFANQSFPSLTRLSRPTGEALARAANAPQAARATWEYMSRVLKIGNTPLARLTPEESQLAGAIWMERRFRQYRETLRAQGLDDSQVRTLVGQEGSPLQTEADYVAGREGMWSFWEAVRQEWTPEVERNYRGLMGLEPGEGIDSPSQIPGLPLNAIALGEGELGKPGVVGTGRRSGLEGQRLNRPGFTRKAELNSPAYDVDLLRMMRRTLDQGVAAARRVELVQTGIDNGVIARVGGSAPPPKESFDYQANGHYFSNHPETPAPPGWHHVEGEGVPEGQVRLERDRKPPEGWRYLGLDVTAGLSGLDPNARYFAHPDAAPDLVRGLGITEPGGRPGQQLVNLARPAVDALYSFALMSPVELATHTANHFTALFRPGMGVPIANIKESVRNAYRILTHDPETLRRLKGLAEMSANFGHEARPGLLESGANVLGRMGYEASPETMARLRRYDPTHWINKFTSGYIETIQGAVRLQLADAYDRVAASGRFPATETGKRDFINQALGNYNASANSRLTQFLKDTGLQSFATAAHTFTLQGVKAATGGAINARATTYQSAAQLRMVAAIKLLPALALGPVINALVWGNAFPRGVPAFAIKTREDDESVHYYDPLSFTGQRRGARMIGLNAWVENAIHGDQTAMQTLDRAAREATMSLEHLFAGPPAQFVHTAITGEDAMGHRVAQRVPRNDPYSSQTLRNLGAAGLNVNPLIGTFGHADRPRTPRTVMENVFQSIGPFGERSRRLQ